MGEHKDNAKTAKLHTKTAVKLRKDGEAEKKMKTLRRKDGEGARVTDRPSPSQPQGHGQ